MIRNHWLDQDIPRNDGWINITANYDGYGNVTYYVDGSLDCIPKSPVISIEVKTPSKELSEWIDLRKEKATHKSSREIPVQFHNTPNKVHDGHDD